MGEMNLAADLAMVLVGGTGLFEGFDKLGSSPLWAVLIILGAMFFLLFPVAELCGARAGLRRGRAAAPARVKSRWKN